jgi:hypothetical protein
MEVIAVLAFVAGLVVVVACTQRANRTRDDHAADFVVLDWVRAEPEIHEAVPNSFAVPESGSRDDGEFVAIPRRNLTARCYLTGMEVGSCTCSKHLGKN